MRGKTNPVIHLFSGIVMILALAMGACDSDDVTGPIEARNPPPTNPSTNNAVWAITVTASPDQLDLNAGSSAVQILVSARRSETNQPVASGTTALLTTTDGTLTTNDGQTGDSVPIVFDAAGQSRAILNTGVFTIDTTIIVRAQIESSFGSAGIQLIDVEAAPFQIASVSPSTGPPSGGTTLTISGSGFVSPARVLVGGVVADNTQVQSSTRITAQTPEINLPSGSNSTVAVTVENGFNENGNPTATDSLAGAFTYTRSGSTTTLKLISLSPTQGPNEGGTQVTIRGEGFGQEAQVYFSNGPLIEATVLSITPTRLDVITPSATGPNAPNANSQVNVTVRDPTSGQQATLNGGFQYGGAGGQMFISSIRPTEGEYLGGDEVTLFGQGFEEPVAVEAGGLAQQVLSVSGTEILFRTVGANIGCSSVSGGSQVVNIETNESTNGPAFTYRPVQPQILGVIPSTGVEGTTLTITGVGRGYTVGFDPPIRITIGGVNVAGALSGTFQERITVIAPPFTGTYETEQCAGGGEGNAVTFVDVQVTNLNTGCNDTFNNAFGYIPPADTTCAGGGVGGTQVASTFTLDFGANETSGSLGPYTFSAASASPPVLTPSLQWWFDADPNVDDPQEVGIVSPTYTFQVLGTYQVTLRYENTTGFVGTQSFSFDIN